MRYEHTTVKNIKRETTTGVYYFRRGKVEQSLKTKDFKEAKVRAKVKMLELDAIGTASTTLKMNDVSTSYKESRTDLREGSQYELNYILDQHLLPYFGKLLLYKITPATWAKYCRTKVGLDLANHRKVMWGFLKWAEREGYIAAKPDISHIPAHERRKRRIATPQELVAIAEHVRGSMRLFFALALYNGMRRKEIMRLRWENVNLDAGNSWIKVVADYNKLGRGREMPINEVVRGLLVDRAKSSKGSWVFPNAKDARLPANVSGLKTAWRTALKNAKVSGLTWHDLRATYEKYANKSTAHTDMQKEKFADASMDVQKRHYVSMTHDDLKGLESVVNVSGLDQILKPTRGERGVSRD